MAAPRVDFYVIEAAGVEHRAREDHIVPEALQAVLRGKEKVAPQMEFALIQRTGSLSQRNVRSESSSAASAVGVIR